MSLLRTVLYGHTVSIMRVKVVALRRNGLRLDIPVGQANGADMYPAEYLKSGVLDYGGHQMNGVRAKGLMLRAVTASPGMGIILALYQPTPTFVDTYSLGYRGFELGENGAGVLQEWRVFPAM